MSSRCLTSYLPTRGVTLITLVLQVGDCKQFYFKSSGHGFVMGNVQSLEGRPVEHRGPSTIQSTQEEGSAGESRLVLAVP